MTNRKKVIIATISLLVVLFLTYLVWPKSKSLAAMRSQLLQAPDDAFRRMGELPWSQRRPELFGDMMERRLAKRAEEYYRLPPEKRPGYLDRQIEEMEKRRREMEARRNQDGQGGGPGQWPGQGQGPGGQGSKRWPERWGRRSRRSRRRPQSRAPEPALPNDERAAGPLRPGPTCRRGLLASGIQELHESLPAWQAGDRQRTSTKTWKRDPGIPEMDLRSESRNCA